MEAAISELVQIGRGLFDPIAFLFAMGLGLFLATGTAARLLTTIQDLAPTRRIS